MTDLSPDAIAQIRQRAKTNDRFMACADRRTLLDALAARDAEIQGDRDEIEQLHVMENDVRVDRERIADDNKRLRAQVQDAAKAGWCPCCDSRPQHCKPELWPNSKRHGLNEVRASTRAALNVGTEFYEQSDTAAQS